MLPDVGAIDKVFDYLVPEGVFVRLGDVVRVDLHGRRVGGWIVAIDVAPPEGVALLPLAKVSGHGPAADLLALSTWAAWRWAGPRASFLRTATPPAVVRRLPAPAPPPARSATHAPLPGTAEYRALAEPRAVLRLAPGADRYALVRAAVATPTPVEGGRTLVLCPSVAEARALGARLRRDGVVVAVMAHETPGAAAAGDWSRAAAGAVVVGSRAAAWAPVTPLGRVVVLDEHDEVYQQEQTPTWHARDVVTERAARAGAPCLLVSPCPSLEALAWGRLVTTDHGVERAGWPHAQVVDQRDLDPALGPLFSPALVDLVRGPGRILCVLNRTGRARLLACAACTTLARCAVCDAAVSQHEDEPVFACGRCGTIRPQVCLSCGGSRFKNLRLGLSRAREELEVLAREPVAELAGVGRASDPGPDADRMIADARIVIGTEAILHRIGRADHVAFLDLDQELLALRYRAAETTLALLARAARLVRRAGGGRGRGRVLVQTRVPDHPVLAAFLAADPSVLAASELAVRTELGLPPVTAMALVSGAVAPAFIESFGRPEGIQVQGPVDGAWRLRAPDHDLLCDALAATHRPPGRLRLEVDPQRA